MSRNKDHPFVETDTEVLVSLLVSAYEHITGATVRPASPERLFIQWVSNIIVQERVLLNYVGNQNIPSRAEGENLDALAELFYTRSRPEATAAACTARFTITQPRPSAILIPAGTRMTDAGGTLVWATTADAYIPIGETETELPLRCQTAGTVGNGWAAGQIDTLVDLFDYCSECVNITASDGGADRATDDEFYELMRLSMDAYSCAGARGAYIYHAKQVSTEIADVAAISPTPGVVKLYVLMENGEPAGDEVKTAVLAACSADTVRPLTDQVFAEDAETVEYDIDLTYYTQEGGGQSMEDIRAAVDAAVDTYTAWQSGRLGRDINPSRLIALLMETGIKRVELHSPVFTSLRDGSDKTVPQVAKRRSLEVRNGGYEDE